MSEYTEDPAWADIEPLPQDDAGSALAAIAYSDEYSEAMSYLRAVMAKNELSERVLALTEHIITMNPAHYTVWLYRAKAIFALNRDLRQEMEWLNTTALRHLKNYQIWHHRQTIIDKLDSADGEADFIAEMFAKDAKNYHVWSYRQWLVKRFNLWDAGEVEACEKLLEKDVRNNSAWNHRWFVVFGRGESIFEDKAIVERELEFAKKAIRLAPQNQSPWNYLRGVLRRAKRPASSEKAFVTEFVPQGPSGEVRSSHALDMLADILVEEGKGGEEVGQVFHALSEKYDPIRAKYWSYRAATVTAASAG